MALRIIVEKNEVSLLYPFEYYLETLHALPYARITVETGDGITGTGEIACSLDADGETAASAIALVEPITAALGDVDIRNEEDIREALRRYDLHLVFNRATKCGLEQALFDILAKRRQTTVSALFGAQYRPAKIQCTIPYLEDTAAYEARFASILPAAPEQVKFKLGKNLPLEAEMIRRFRVLAPDTGINVDANQAFPTAAAAAEFLASIESVRLSWAEQLLPREDVEAWRNLRKLTTVPLMADESIHTSREARWYLENKLVDFINVKLAKSGGVIEARKIVALAKEHGVGVILGSMLHGESGLRYNLTFGLSQPFITFDFYSYFSLKDRPNPPLIDKESLTIQQGVLS
jgi:L-alanine-DL-glutamate epimerase-like enolase superfamily enzyme